MRDPFILFIEGVYPSMQVGRECVSQNAIEQGGVHPLDTHTHTHTLTGHAPLPWTPPRKACPHRDGLETGDTHPTGMHSCVFAGVEHLS